MDRNDFLNRGKNPSTVLNHKKALKKLDLYLDEKQITESKFLEMLEGFEVSQRYNALQEVINFISRSVSARVTKEYFETIYKYLLLKEIPLDRDQKGLRLNFPRYAKPRFEGLDDSMIKRILEYEKDDTMRSYYSVLYGAGLRETEGLLITPSMIRFNEDPIRLILPKEITKFSIPRETFMCKIPGERIKHYIFENKIRENQTIFGKYDETTLIKFEKRFAKIRKELGMETQNRKPHQQNDITLHSFRAFYTTVFMDNKLDWFGLAITGHTKFMDTYYRNSLEERQKTFQTVYDKLNF